VSLPVALLASGLYRTLGPDVRHYVEVARVAEALGFVQITLPDHVMMGERTDRYPYGRFPAKPEDPWPEPLTVLAAIAGATSTIRLGTGVLISPLRPAVLLAKQVATLDNLSGGRVDLGIGTGWQPEEYAASGVPFAGRWARVDDQMRACRALWQGGPTTFASPTVSFERIWCSPLPAQARVPVWFGAPASAATAARLAEYGDGWLPIGLPSPDDVAAGAAVLRDALVARDRPADELRVRAGLAVVRDASGAVDGPATFAPVNALADAGATLVSVSLAQGLGTMPEITRFLEELAKAGR
jgi:probable F420-dependent oxidoreductase